MSDMACLSGRSERRLGGQGACDTNPVVRSNVKPLAPAQVLATSHALCGAAVGRVEATVRRVCVGHLVNHHTMILVEGTDNTQVVSGIVSICGQVSEKWQSNVCSNPPGGLRDAQPLDHSGRGIEPPAQPCTRSRFGKVTACIP